MITITFDWVSQAAWDLIRRNGGKRGDMKYGCHELKFPAGTWLDDIHSVHRGYRLVRLPDGSELPIVHGTRNRVVLITDDERPLFMQARRDEALAA